MEKAIIAQTVDTRIVDDLGRVVIPKTLRVRFDIIEGDEISFIDNGDSIALQKSQPCCCICRSLESITHLGEDNKAICQICLEKIKEL